MKTSERIYHWALMTGVTILLIGGLIEMALCQSCYTRCYDIGNGRVSCVTSCN